MRLGYDGPADAPAADDETALDLLALLEAMGSHFHEHHQDIIRWPWMLFCRKWCRLIKWSAEEREREHQRDLEHKWQELRNANQGR